MIVSDDDDDDKQNNGDTIGTIESSFANPIDDLSVVQQKNIVVGLPLSSCGRRGVTAFSLMWCAVRVFVLPTRADRLYRLPSA